MYRDDVLTDIITLYYIVQVYVQYSNVLSRCLVLYYDVFGLRYYCRIRIAKSDRKLKRNGTLNSYIKSRSTLLQQFITWYYVYKYFILYYYIILNR